MLQAGTKAARLYQRARLLQLAALELHCADLAVQSASCKSLLEVFFLPFDTDEDTGIGLCCCPLSIHMATDFGFCLDSWSNSLAFLHLCKAFCRACSSSKEWVLLAGSAIRQVAVAVHPLAPCIPLSTEPHMVP